MYKDPEALFKMTRGIIKDPSDFQFDMGSELVISKGHLGFSKLVSFDGHTAVIYQFDSIFFTYYIEFCR